jgi:hypothetical protein
VTASGTAEASFFFWIRVEVRRDADGRRPLRVPNVGRLNGCPWLVVAHPVGQVNDVFKCAPGDRTPRPLDGSPIGPEVTGDVVRFRHKGVLAGMRDEFRLVIEPVKPVLHADQVAYQSDQGEIDGGHDAMTSCAALCP